MTCAPALWDKARMTTTALRWAYFAAVQLLFVCSFDARAAGNMATPKIAQANVLVLRGGTVFDSRTGRMVPNQTILIRGERIESVGSRLSASAIPRDRVMFGRSLTWSGSSGDGGPT